MGTVVSAAKQWWLKVSNKPMRTHALDGAVFPYIIKVKYTVDEKDFTCRKWINAGNRTRRKGALLRSFMRKIGPPKQELQFKSDFKGSHPFGGSLFHADWKLF